MSDIKIVRYTGVDNDAALLLEDQCTQGKSLVLKYQRPTFHARSEVYDNYKILCAKSGSILIGTIAGTVKTIHLHGEEIQAVYVYDLRVHPDFRRKGIGKKLTNALLEEIGEIDCIYSFIAGGNEKALALATRNFEAEVIIPLTYLVVPVYKMLEEKEEYRFKTASEVHELFLKNTPDLEFVPKFDELSLYGLISSITLSNSEHAGCSIWTNENLLAEQVVRIPLFLKLMKMFTIPLRPFMKLPSIPEQNEIIRSWFLFDFYGKDRVSIRNLLAVVNKLVLINNRTYLYMLLQAGSSMVQFINAAGLKVFKFPYYFLAKGTNSPNKNANLYIDVRDL